ncbi:aminodeoxychorismate lyase [Enterovibrio norvegicus FF-162]|uniref:aminodeoxychorismate lyase n=1 Tax=Enterovibrio norvegicus TaxID=188144 RepID=UPI0002E5DE9D|nr:aminodeoxychorismate lyase [Enterovibrio norvegicus]OEE76329.1 aminodeoxychorismate lyase [Enterovibrio norvegicus FF-162]
MILLNGQASDHLPLSDRGLQYGDGCYTTMLSNHGVLRSWPLHLARLTSNTEALGIQGIDWDLLTAWAESVSLSQKDKAEMIVKILITRGSGGRGYSPQGCQTPNVVVSSHPSPAHYEQWREKGIQMGMLQQRLGLSPLAGLKHLNRLEQVLIKQEVDALGLDDGVVCDLNGKLIETSASNLFWRKGDNLFTPDLSLSGVEGTMRAEVINAAPGEGFHVSIVSAEPDVLIDADEIFITNAVMGLVPVRCVEKTFYSSFLACRAITLRLSA